MDVVSANDCLCQIVHVRFLSLFSWCCSLTRRSRFGSKPIWSMDRNLESSDWVGPVSILWRMKVWPLDFPLEVTGANSPWAYSDWLPWDSWCISFIRSSRQKRRLDVYFLSSVDTLSFSPVGDNFLYPKTSYSARNYAFPMSFPPNENCKVFIKLSAQLEPIEIPIFLSSESFYFKRAKNDFFYLGVFTGLFFLFILFLICLYIFSKNNVFLYYANLNLIIFLFYISQTGFGFQYIWPNYPIVQKLMPSLTVFGFLLLTTFFIKNLFNLAIRFSNFNKLFNLINVLLVLSFIFNYIYSFSPF